MAGKKKTTGPAPSDLDWAEVERVLKLMSRHELEEFEYSDGAFHLRLKKATAGKNSNPAEMAAAPPPPVAAQAPPPAPPAPAPAPAAEPEPPAAAAAEKPHLVKSPIVGTFYSAPSPGAPPFIKMGDHVQNGQVLCIIEAMKLMNEIESDVAGEIVRIFVENGQPVEYGEPLFAVRPNPPARPA
jgi:acetyl-CoA carboxylase biotin carboxyl carrier protein